MSTVKVRLSRTYTSPEGNFDSLDLREPTYRDRHMDGIGAPAEWQMLQTGAPMFVVHPATVDAYVQRLLVAPKYEFIGSISASDAGRLEQAVLAFFRDAPTAN
ncbi:hypothetical protein SAMN05880590_10175 [Rhizobium sp. RU35A]|uniref:hypothetical protein n=1 Tax=Rhizobium sp. RU35A TaxID=1907414 RepID=UPI00095586C6|nr:hypothetical protein [Rhizobium sp. RU35A]SIP89835.1 hypothetical protein SAMN05880590_10175 [Rhizobium sp. RU35A]